MSSYVRYKGTIKEANISESEALDLIKSRNPKFKSIPKYFNNYFEYLADQYDNEFIIINNKLFFIKFDVKSRDDFDFIDLFKNEDGSYDFHTLFYDGGTCLSEELKNKLNE